MPALQEQYDEKQNTPAFRLDVRLHDLLTKAPAPRPTLVQNGTEKFPEPVFPQHPDLLAQDDNYEANLALAKAGNRR